MHTRWLVVVLSGSMLACSAAGRGCVTQGAETVAHEVAKEAVSQGVREAIEASAASAASPVGLWMEETGFVGEADSPEACAQTGGLWHEFQCLRVGKNTVELLGEQDGAWPTKVRTVGAPGWACELTGWARREGDHLRVQSDGEPACSLLIRINGESMTVADEGPCVTFHCGRMGDFTITHATRR